jgi:tripartite-type tricarboxylate transporter receptor subunit TctC
MTLWYGLWAPANTRPNVIEKLTAAAQDAMADPAVRQRLHDLGMQIPPREKQTPQALYERQTADIAKWWPIIKAANIKPD